MYLTPKTAFVRNLAAAILNGTITLIILLIAPLGLLAVIVNTLLISLSTFLVCAAGDRLVLWLSPSVRDHERLGNTPFQTEIPPLNKTKRLDPGDHRS